MLPHPLEIHINVLIHSVLERASLQMNIQRGLALISSQDHLRHLSQCWFHWFTCLSDSERLDV